MKNFPAAWRLRAALIGAVLAVLLLALHWRPSRQVRLHQDHLLGAVQDRKWKSVGEFFAEDYKDRWGQTKPDALSALPQAFGDFLACGVISENARITWQEGAPTVHANIRIVGSGGPIAQFVMQQSRALTEPFSFRWRRGSWRPWDWKLVAVDQPQFEVPAEVNFGP